MRIMFDAISVTNETSFVPSTSGGVDQGEDDGAGGGMITLSSRGKNNPLSPQMVDPLVRKGQLPLPSRERRRRLLDP
jgi:hypothetical protein